MWDYFVLGLVVEVVVVTIGAGGGMTIPPTGLIAVKGFIGMIAGGGWDIANGILTADLSYFSLSFFFFWEALSLDLDTDEEDELDFESDDDDYESE